MLRNMAVLTISVISSWMFLLSAAAQIESVGLAGDGEFTRITLASGHDLQARTYFEDVDGARLLHVVPSSLSVSAQPYWGAPSGGVSAYTIDDGRITFELDRPMLILRELELPPTGQESRHRLVLDLTSVSEARFSKIASLHQNQLARAEAAKLDEVAVQLEPELQTISHVPENASRSFKDVIIEAANRPRRRIAIDPGHGGRDPGAPIVSGGEEKSIVLKTSLILKELLEEDPRYDVLLTRVSDVYVEHEDRVSMAREWDADLFISIHADAALRPDVSGASVYTISTRGEKRIAGTADKYGWQIPVEDGTPEEVGDILTELVKRETKSNSAIFADTLLPELAKAGPLVRNSHRQGNLFVLLAPDVPAVLVEIGFLSNRADAKRLKSSKGRKKSAEAIKRGIDTYFGQQDLLLATN